MSFFVARRAFNAPSLRGRTNNVYCGSGLGVLGTAKPLSRKGLGGCKNPTKPVPLRKLARDSHEALVELVTFGSPHPSCALPRPTPLSQEVQHMLSLESIQPQTLLQRITQLEQQLAGLSDCQRYSICSHPAFAAFIERCLEVVSQRGMGPAAPMLLLRVLSMLRFGGDANLREAYLQYHRHLVTVLEDSVKRDPAAYTTQDSLRLLVAFSMLHTKTGGQYSPSSYDVSDLVSAVVFGLPAMRADQLGTVCLACSAFEWPLYRSPVWALDCVAQEVLRRLHTGSLPRPAARQLLEQAVQGAYTIRPRLGGELEARIAQWEVQVLAGAATLSTAQRAASWTEIEEAAATLSHAVALSLAQLAAVAH